MSSLSLKSPVTSRSRVVLFATAIAIAFYATSIGMSVIGGVREALWDIPGARATLILFLLAGLINWFVFVALPMISTSAVLRGKKQRIWILDATALAAVAIFLTFGVRSTLWYLSLAAVAALIVAAAVGTLLVLRPGDWAPAQARSAQRPDKEPLVAQRLLVFGGLLGLHALYLRRGWETVLLLALLALSFVSYPSPLGAGFLFIASCLLASDFIRLDQLTAIANR